MKRRSFLAAATTSAAFMPAVLRAQTPVAPPLIAFARDPEVERAAISPDGTLIALVGSEKGQKLILISNLKTEQVTAYPMDTLHIGRFMFVGNKHLVFSTLRYDKNSQSDLTFVHMIDLDTKDVRTLSNSTQYGGRANSSQIFRFKDKGKNFVAVEFAGADEDIGYQTSAFTYNLKKFDLSSKAMKPLAFDRGSDSTMSRVVDREGNLIAREEYDFNNKRWWIEMSEGTHFREVFGLDQVLDLPSLMGLGRDGKSVVLYFKTGEHAGHLVNLAADGTLSRIYDREAFSYLPLFHPNTDRLCGCYTGEHWPMYHYDAPDMAKIDAAVKEYVGADRYEYVDFTDDPRKVIVYYEGDEITGKYVLLDLLVGSELELGTTFPDVEPPFISKQQSFTYLAQDGLEIQAYLSLPTHNKADTYPLVVLPHGGPQSRDMLGFDWMVQALTSRGYAVVQPNFRGSTGFGPDFEAAGYGEWGRKMQTDLSDAVAHLIKQGVTTADRVSIMGGSYGGYAALAGVTLQSDIYNCAISIAGVSDLKLLVYFQQFSTIWKKYFDRNWDGIDLDTRAPITYASKVDVPVLLIHGNKDLIVEDDQSIRMHDALRKAGKDSTLLLLTGEGHNLIFEASRLKLIEASVAFLAKHNPV